MSESILDGHFGTFLGVVEGTHKYPSEERSLCLNVKPEPRKSYVVEGTHT